MADELIPLTDFHSAPEFGGLTPDERRAQETAEIQAHFQQVEDDAKAAAADRARAGVLLDANAPAEAALALVFGPVADYRRMIAGWIYASASLKAEKEKLLEEGNLPAARTYGARAAQFDAAVNVLRPSEAQLIQDAGSLQ